MCVFSCYTLTGSVNGNTATGTISNSVSWTATMSGSGLNVNVDAGSVGTCSGTYSTTANGALIIKMNSSLLLFVLVVFIGTFYLF